MATRRKPRLRVPEGLGFHAVHRRVETLCAQTTDTLLQGSKKATRKNLGKKAPYTYKKLGTVLSLLYQYSMCRWGCAKGDHVVEHLTARATTSALAALTLMKCGCYDDALTIVRRIGEQANLFVLFRIDPSALTLWKNLTQEGRWAQLGFERVRQRLQEKGAPIPMKVPSYREMGARGTHATATTKPQSYSGPNVPPIVGPGILQPAAILIVLNELSVYMAWIAAALDLATLPKEQRARMRKAALALDAAVGAANVGWLRPGQVLEKVFRHSRPTPRSSGSTHRRNFVTVSPGSSSSAVPLADTKETKPPRADVPAAETT